MSSWSRMSWHPDQMVRTVLFVVPARVHLLDLAGPTVQSHQGVAPQVDRPLRGVPRSATSENLPLRGAGWCQLIVATVDRARNLLSRRTVRRAPDALTGTMLLPFGARRGTES